MTVTLQQLIAAPVGSTVMDVSNDQWTKVADGTWDLLDHSEASQYHFWTSEKLDEWYNDSADYSRTLHDLSLSDSVQIGESDDRRSSGNQTASQRSGFDVVSDFNESDFVNKQDLADYLASTGMTPNDNQYGVMRRAIYFDLQHHFDLPEVTKEQTLVVTLKVPVNNQNPLGDVWRLALQEMDDRGIDLTNTDHEGIDATAVIEEKK